MISHFGCTRIINLSNLLSEIAFCIPESYLFVVYKRFSMLNILRLEGGWKAPAVGLCVQAFSVTHKNVLTIVVSVKFQETRKSVLY